MTFRIQLKLMRLTLSLFAMTSPSTELSASSMNVSLFFIHGHTIWTRLTSSTLWTITWLKRSAKTCACKTHKFSGSVSSRANPLYPQMISLELSESLLTWTKFHNSTLKVCQFISKLQSMQTLCFQLLNMQRKLLNLSNKLLMLDTSTVTMLCVTKWRLIMIVSRVLSLLLGSHQVSLQLRTLGLISSVVTKTSQLASSENSLQLNFRLKLIFFADALSRCQTRLLLINCIWLLRL